jgi:hypothetical protein
VLYILDMKQKKLVIIDPKPIPEYALDVPVKPMQYRLYSFSYIFSLHLGNLILMHGWMFIHSNLSVQKGLRKTLERIKMSTRGGGE